MADMRDPMSAERFADLVATYGGRVDRWPMDAQDAGHVYAATVAGRSILMQALEFDVLLDSYVVAAPGAALQGRIIAGFKPQSSLQTQLSRWWQGLGLVGVGVAGIVAGSVAMSLVLAGPPPESDGFYDQPTTVFGDVGPTASLGANASEEAQ
jgi:hypothetical protein